MLELVEEVKSEAMTEPNFFEEAVTDETIIPDGEELVDAAEDLQAGGNVPEDNITDSVDHYHDPDGTPVTEIGGETISPAAEAAAAPAAEVAAAPAAEAVAASASEIVEEV